MIDHALDRAALAIATADALLIGAGAGMGVDSGLPDFRGKEGFWRAYPPYQRLGLDFVALANPRWFTEDADPGLGFLRAPDGALSANHAPRGVLDP